MKKIIRLALCSLLLCAMLAMAADAKYMYGFIVNYKLAITAGENPADGVLFDESPTGNVLYNPSGNTAVAHANFGYDAVYYTPAILATPGTANSNTGTTTGNINGTTLVLTNCPAGWYAFEARGAMGGNGLPGPGNGGVGGRGATVSGVTYIPTTGTILLVAGKSGGHDMGHSTSSGNAFPGGGSSGPGAGGGGGGGFSGIFYGGTDYKTATAVAIAGGGGGGGQGGGYNGTEAPANQAYNGGHGGAGGTNNSGAAAAPGLGGIAGGAGGGPDGAASPPAGRNGIAGNGGGGGGGGAARSKGTSTGSGGQGGSGGTMSQNNTGSGAVGGGGGGGQGSTNNVADASRGGNGGGATGGAAVSNSNTSSGGGPLQGGNGLTASGWCGGGGGGYTGGASGAYASTGGGSGGSGGGGGGSSYLKAWVYPLSTITAANFPGYAAPSIPSLVPGNMPSYVENGYVWIFYLGARHPGDTTNGFDEKGIDSGYVNLP